MCTPRPSPRKWRRVPPPLRLQGRGHSLIARLHRMSTRVPSRMLKRFCPRTKTAPPCPMQLRPPLVDLLTYYQGRPLRQNHPAQLCRLPSPSCLRPMRCQMARVDQRIVRRWRIRQALPARTAVRHRRRTMTSYHRHPPLVTHPPLATRIWRRPPVAICTRLRPPAALEPRPISMTPRTRWRL